MVDFSSTPVITGILDWHGPIFAPDFMAATAPRWLWRTQEEDETPAEQTNEENSDLYEPKFDKNLEPIDVIDIEPDSPEDAEIKEAFDNIMGEEWKRQAYSLDYIFARRILLASFAIYGWGPYEAQQIKDLKSSRDKHFLSSVLTKLPIKRTSCSTYDVVL
ncbi:putative Aminoglycoside phosphotransferase domain-containing protein [Seiridium cardinale]|uniref:Aminoglycoside phosphotransferase domain-containing protein n=1 Tax=Seiridium cardinale TaxID=138064 RepID=A0ABR2Y012_9PEZI